MKSCPAERNRKAQIRRHPQLPTLSGRRGKDRTAADLQLWSAVALQAHMVQSIKAQGGSINAGGVGSSLLPHSASRLVDPPPPQRVRSPNRRPARGRPAPQGDQPQATSADPEAEELSPRRRLTLAERMGLVPAPPLAPTAEEWSAIVARTANRGDAVRPCSICHVSMLLPGGGAQVVLDCSHVFHLTCLKQFERYVRRSGVGQRACPICRKQHYHRRIHYEGEAQIQHHATVKIQSLFRRALARKRYLRLRLQHNPAFKREYYFQKLSSMTDAYLSYAAVREKEVDRFLEEVEVTRQRAVADMLSERDWERLRSAALQRILADGVRATPLGVLTIANGGEVRDVAPEPEHQEAEAPDCPICMHRLQPPVTATATASGRSCKSAPTAISHSTPMLLSCGHCFHDACLGAFEAFARTSHGSNAALRCPLCRSGYAKRPL